jgi:hypothetical protein
MKFSITFETRRLGDHRWEMVQSPWVVTDPYEAEQAFAALAKEYAIAIDDERFGGDGLVLESRVTMTVTNEKED